jgi:multiple sugar transport system permease protein
VSPAAEPPDRRGRPHRRLFGREPIGMALAAPYTVFIAAIFAYPLGLALWISFHKYFFTAPGAVVPRPFVGLRNYRAVIADPQVRQALGNTVVFLLVNVPLTTVAALVLATALNAAIPLRGFFRTAYYLPYVTASVAVVSVWLWLFSTGGLAEKVLGPLSPKPPWLVNSHLAMPLIAAYVAWKQLGFFIVVYLAALQGVPKELHESAAIDGAGRLRTWWSVTIPNVRPATALVVTLSTIVGANLFTEPYLLTAGGGPNGASATPVLVIYQRGIQQGAPDFAAALGVLLVIVVLALALAYRRFFERE